ncbi:flavodoxin family protein [Nocardia noduli]|uniref:flavodoxin family protein n=1 Tax=Nocardia noduli TaxID=2815722 RepID=UPI001C21758F|nr:NAD(P)H-dependent oxidoreductase [Nocardia noduli]
MSELSAVASVCTLRRSPSESSSDLIARQVLKNLAAHDVAGEVVRVLDYDVHPGVSTDEGDGDQWPILRQRILDAEIVLIATPTWLGHMSSVAQRLLERLDAELSETDEHGHPSTVGEVGLAAVVGNEDGAHKISADLFQALNDSGFTVPAQGCAYWNDHAMGSTHYKDLDQVATTTATLARNAAHMAHLLRTAQYPPHQ